MRTGHRVRFRARTGTGLARRSASSRAACASPYQCPSPNVPSGRVANRPPRRSPVRCRSACGPRTGRSGRCSAARPRVQASTIDPPLERIRPCVPQARATASTRPRRGRASVERSAQGRAGGVNPHAFQDRGQTATIRPDSAARTLLTSRRSAADPPARSSPPRLWHEGRAGAGQWLTSVLIGDPLGQRWTVVEGAVAGERARPDARVRLRQVRSGFHKRSRQPCRSGRGSPRGRRRKIIENTWNPRLGGALTCITGSFCPHEPVPFKAPGNRRFSFAPSPGQD